VPFLLAVVLGLAFGAADQYLGSRSATLGLWASTAAQMSAPWLVLPFVIGMAQPRPRRAMIVGLVVTASALVGYFALTYSPMEVPGWNLHRFIAGLVAVTTTGYNPLYIAGGLVTGPLFGLMGHRWRARRSRASAALVAGALCLEPLARRVAGQLPPPAPVWTVEVAAGTVVVALFTFALLAGSRRSAPIAPPVGSDD
jgi:hypothetical protein